MSQNALIAQGLQFQYGDGASPTEGFTALAEFVDLPTAPNFTVESREVTTFNSPNDFREYKAGMKNPGTLGIAMHFIPGDPDDTWLQGLFAAPVTGNYRIIWPTEVGGTGSARRWSFAAFPTNQAPAAGIGDVMINTVTFQISGQIFDEAVA